MGRESGRGAVEKTNQRSLFTVLSLNAGSIINKTELLRSECYQLTPDFVFICETFANENISDMYLKIDGYELISRLDGRDTTNGRTRGILMYAKQGLQGTKLVIRGADTCTECAGISVPWGGVGHTQEWLNLVMVYRPPRNPGSEADGGNTARLVQSLGTLEGNVVIFGDFNMPDVDWEINWSSRAGDTMLLDLLGDKFWYQVVRKSNHRDDNTLDLVMPSSAELVASVENVGYLSPTSDHIMQVTTLVGPARVIESMEEVPDWSKADYGAIKSALELIDWEEEFRDKAGDECMDLFYKVIKRETERCIPKKLRRKSSRPMWMTKNIMRLLRKKMRLLRNYSNHKYYRQDYESLQAYKKVQSDVKKAVKVAKRKLERSLAKAAKKNPKQFYSYLKNKTSNRVSVGPLKEGDRVVTDDKQMADMLNTYFCSVFTHEDLANMRNPEQLYRGEETLSEVEFTAEKVKKKLSALKPTAAPGPDGVWTRILRISLLTLCHIPFH